MEPSKAAAFTFTRMTQLRAAAGRLGPFQQMPARVREEMVRRMKPSSCHAHEAVVDPRDRARRMCIVLSGTVAVFVAPPGGAGRPEFACLLRPGDSFGSRSLLSGPPSSSLQAQATELSPPTMAVSVTDVEVALLEGDDFDEVLRSFDPPAFQWHPPGDGELRAWGAWLASSSHRDRLGFSLSEALWRTIRQNPLLAALDETLQPWGSLQLRAQLRRLEPGEVLLSQGDVPGSAALAYVLLRGRLSVHRRTDREQAAAGHDASSTRSVEELYGPCLELLPPGSMCGTDEASQTHLWRRLRKKADYIVTRAQTDQELSWSDFEDDDDDDGGGEEGGRGGRGGGRGEGDEGEQEDSSRGTLQVAARKPPAKGGARLKRDLRRIERAPLSSSVVAFGPATVLALPVNALVEILYAEAAERRRSGLERVRAVLGRPPGTRTAAEVADAVRTLRHLKFFSKMGVETVRLMSRVLTLEACPRGAVLCRQGGPGDMYGIVFDGLVSVHLRPEGASGGTADRPETSADGEGGETNPPALAVAVGESSGIPGPTEAPVASSSPSATPGGDRTRSGATITLPRGSFSGARSSGSLSPSPSPRSHTTSPRASLSAPAGVALDLSSPVGGGGGGGADGGETRQAHRGSARFRTTRGTRADVMTSLDEDYLESRLGRCVVRLGPGTGFGERSIVYSSPCTASVVCREPTTVLWLPAADYIQIFGRQSIRDVENSGRVLAALKTPPGRRSPEELDAVVEGLRLSEIFLDMPLTLRRLAAQNFAVEWCDADTVIYQEDDRAEHVFVVLRGSVALHRRAGGPGNEGQSSGGNGAQTSRSAAAAAGPTTPVSPSASGGASGQATLRVQVDGGAEEAGRTAGPVAVHRRARSMAMRRFSNTFNEGSVGGGADSVVHTGAPSAAAVASSSSPSSATQQPADDSGSSPPPPQEQGPGRRGSRVMHQRRSSGSRIAGDAHLDSVILRSSVTSSAGGDEPGASHGGVGGDDSTDGTWTGPMGRPRTLRGADAVAAAASGSSGGAFAGVGGVGGGGMLSGRRRRAGDEDDEEFLSDLVQLFGPRVAELGPGAAMGTAELTTSTTRPHTAITREPTAFVTLGRMAFMRTLKRAKRAGQGQLQQEEWADQLRLLHPFAAMNRVSLIRAAFYLEERTFRCGEVLLEQGVPPTHIMVVVRGECRLDQAVRVVEATAPSLPSTGSGDGNGGGGDDREAGGGIAGGSAGARRSSCTHWPGPRTSQRGAAPASVSRSSAASPRSTGRGGGGPHSHGTGCRRATVTVEWPGLQPAQIGRCHVVELALVGPGSVLGSELLMPSSTPAEYTVTAVTETVAVLVMPASAALGGQLSRATAARLREALLQARAPHAARRNATLRRLLSLGAARCGCGRDPSNGLTERGTRHSDAPPAAGAAATRMPSDRDAERDDPFLGSEDAAVPLVRLRYTSSDRTPGREVAGDRDQPGDGERSPVARDPQSPTAHPAPSHQQARPTSLSRVGKFMDTAFTPRDRHQPSSPTGRGDAAGAVVAEHLKQQLDCFSVDDLALGVHRILRDGGLTALPELQKLAEPPNLPLPSCLLGTGDEGASQGVSDAHLARRDRDRVRYGCPRPAPAPVPVESMLRRFSDAVEDRQREIMLRRSQSAVRLHNALSSAAASLPPQLLGRGRGDDSSTSTSERGRSVSFGNLPLSATLRGRQVRILDPPRASKQSPSRSGSVSALPRTPPRARDVAFVTPEPPQDDGGVVRFPTRIAGPRPGRPNSKARPGSAHRAEGDVFVVRLPTS